MKNKNKLKWYAVKCVFLHKDLKSEIKKGHVYEERITLWHAASFKSAIKKAEKEALQYTKDLAETEYLGFCNIYYLYDEKINNSSEIYSLMRDSKLDPKKYLDKFYDTGTERNKKA